MCRRRLCLPRVISLLNMSAGTASRSGPGQTRSTALQASSAFLILQYHYHYCYHHHHYHLFFLRLLTCRLLVRSSFFFLLFVSFYSRSFSLLMSASVSFVCPEPAPTKTQMKSCQSLLISLSIMNNVQYHYQSFNHFVESNPCNHLVLMIISATIIIAIGGCTCASNRSSVSRRPGRSSSAALPPGYSVRTSHCRKFRQLNYWHGTAESSGN